LKILITGASGFIGTHLSQHLESSHFIYRIFYRCLSNSADQNIIYADLTDPGFATNFPKSVDCVIHLAQSSKYREFPDSSDDLFQVNLGSTHRLLEWSRINKIRHFVFASTANVYAETNELHQENSLTEPNSYYGATKLAAEQLIKQYKEYFQVDILRLFTVYGSGQSGMLFPSIYNRINAGETITLADGTGLFLTPIHVNDVVTTISELLSNSSSEALRVFNVCGSKVVSLIEVVQHLEMQIGIKAQLATTDERPRFFMGDNRKLMTILGRNELTQLKQGLTLTFLPQSFPTKLT
jgi:UDP-glucose 4-epimerase